MKKIKAFLKTTKGLLIVAVTISLLIGFFLGIQYENNRIKKNIQETFNEFFPTSEEKQSNKKTAESVETNLLKEEYIRNDLLLENIRIEEKYENRRIKGVVKNNGNKILNEVEIIVYFLDEEGNPMGEENYYPVLVTEYSFLNDNKPLKPNYVKDFEYIIENDAPPEWSGKIEVEIINIDFAEQES